MAMAQLTWQRFAMVMGAAAMLAACAGPAGTPTVPATSGPVTAVPTPGGTPVELPAEVRSNQARNLSPAATPDDLAAVSAGNLAFAFDLYQQLRSADGNLFYSPYSLSLALAMLYAGARGTTEQQMADVLHFDLPQAQLHPAFNALDLALTGAGQAGAPPFELAIANSVWGQQGYALRPEYLDGLAVNYGAGLRLVDFTQSETREQARQAINAWVADQTASRIPELLAEGVLTDMARLVLANAIYFKGEWEEPFPASNTSPQPFTRLDGSQVTVPLMSRRGMTGFVEGVAGGVPYQAAEVTYKGDRVRMLILLPAEGQFEAFEQALTAEEVEAIAGALKPEDLKLYLPKFSYSAELALGDTLAAMGMPDAFDRERADLSGIAPIPPVLFVSHVIHKAFVAVDELGTEAAAATGIVAEIVSMPEEMRADRPFVFVIRDAPTGSVLFVGRVVDPS